MSTQQLPHSWLALNEEEIISGEAIGKRKLIEIF
jgi:hypothetical protein